MESEGEQLDTGLVKFFFSLKLAIHAGSCRRHLLMAHCNGCPASEVRPDSRQSNEEADSRTVVGA